MGLTNGKKPPESVMQWREMEDRFWIVKALFGAILSGNKTEAVPGDGKAELKCVQIPLQMT